MSNSEQEIQSETCWSLNSKVVEELHNIIAPLTTTHRYFNYSKLITIEQANAS